MEPTSPAGADGHAEQSGGDFELRVGSTSNTHLEVVSFRGREGISRLFSFDVRVLAHPGDAGIDGEWVGHPATLVIPLGGGAPPRLVQGVLASLRHDGVTTTGHRRTGVARLVPRLWLLKQRVSSRVFQGLTVPDIFARVLSLAGLRCTVKLRRAHTKREYCLQYRESDYAFVARIAAEEGLFWYFQHPESLDDDDDETVVLADDPSAYESSDVHLLAREHQGSGQARPDDVLQFTLRQGIAPDAVRLRDYDFQRPTLDLHADAAVDPAPDGSTASLFGAADRAAPALLRGGLSVYEHKSEYDAPDIDAPRARVHLEQRRRSVVVAEGESASRQIAPGHRFQLDVEAVATLSHEYVVTDLRHEGHSPHHTTRSTVSGGLQVYANRFRCLPSDRAARPKRPEPRLQNVLESAIVVGPAGEEIHTDAYGRVKIQFHWDIEGGLNEHSSCWIRVAQNWAGASFGAQFVPRVGMEVMVSFLGGDQDCPVVIGAVYNATHPAPFLLPAGKTRSGLRTQSTPGGGGFNEISFEDARAREQIYLHAQRDLDEVVERNHSEEVKGDSLYHVHGKQICTIDGSRIEQVQGDLARAVAKDEKVQIDGNRVDVVTGNADLRVNGGRNERAGQERREIAGRADLTVGEDYTVRTRGCHTTIVGRDSAKRSYVLRVEGTAQLSASGAMELDSEKSITLRCGKSFLKIGPDKIEIVSPAVSAKGDGGGITVAKDKMRLSAKGEAVLTSEKVILKTKDASLSLKTDVQIDGKKILLNSPDHATDPVTDTAPPPTKIQMKDQSGKPLANQRFVITMPDGAEYSGILDKDGKTEMEFEGSGKITFPDLAKPSGG